MEMRKGNLWRSILLFSIPLMFTNLLQLLFNIVDVAITYCLSAFMDNATAGCRGLGKTVIPTIIVMLGSIAFRIIWIYTVFAYFGTLNSLYILYGCAFVLTAIMGNIYFGALERRKPHTDTISQYVIFRFRRTKALTGFIYFCDATPPVFDVSRPIEYTGNGWIIRNGPVSICQGVNGPAFREKAGIVNDQIVITDTNLNRCNWFSEHMLSGKIKRRESEEGIAL